MIRTQWQTQFYDPIVQGGKDRKINRAKIVEVLKHGRKDVYAIAQLLGFEPDSLRRHLYKMSEKRGPLRTIRTPGKATKWELK